ncbi:MAG: thioredoxin [Candidatus Pacebacteria bacterium]|nr:thioredoxin [Candidatus Paceibacterota bacterium]
MKMELLSIPLIGAGIGALLGYFGKCASGACPLTANPWRGGLIGLLLGGLIAVATIGNAAEKTTSKETGETVAENPLLHIKSAEQFNKDVLQADTLVLVDFYADWCPPCRKLGPILESVAKEHKDYVRVAKVDVDDNRRLAMQYKVRGIPHLMLVRGGNVVSTSTGYTPKEQLVQWIDKYRLKAEDESDSQGNEAK